MPTKKDPYKLSKKEKEDLRKCELDYEEAERSMIAAVIVLIMGLVLIIGLSVAFFIQVIF